MKIGYYPGCTLKTKAANLERPAICALRELGVQVEELDRWNCCGAVYSLSDDDLIHMLAPVRDLIRAQEQGYDKLMALCSMCYNTLARANLLMRDDPEKRDALNNFMEEEVDYRGEVEVVHMLNFIRDHVGFDKLRAAVKNPLEGIKLAPYYGCTLTRPAEITIDGKVTPQVFEDFIRALGAEVVSYGEETACCGSYQSISNPDAASRTSGEIIGAAEGHGADAMILTCPLCDYNLSRRQPEALLKNKNLKPLPVFYFSQLLALAMGLDPEVCSLQLNPAGSLEFLQDRGLLARAIV